MNENIPQNSSNMQTTRKRRQPFTPDEDQKLRTVVNTFGENDWHVICKFMNGRTARQCRDRWREYLMPSLKLTEWTPEEDMILIEKIKECGKKWSVICLSLKGRSETAAKNRWRLLERRRMGVINSKQSKISENDSSSSSESLSSPNSMPDFSASDCPVLPSYIYCVDSSCKQKNQPNVDLHSFFKTLPNINSISNKFPSIMDICPFPL